jgi:hypothetical protein
MPQIKSIILATSLCSLRIATAPGMKQNANNYVTLQILVVVTWNEGNIKKEKKTFVDTCPVP